MSTFMKILNESDDVIQQLILLQYRNTRTNK